MNDVNDGPLVAERLHYNAQYGWRPSYISIGESTSVDWCQPGWISISFVIEVNRVPLGVGASCGRSQRRSRRGRGGLRPSRDPDPPVTVKWTVSGACLRGTPTIGGQSITIVNISDGNSIDVVLVLWVLPGGRLPWPCLWQTLRGLGWRQSKEPRRIDRGWHDASDASDCRRRWHLAGHRRWSRRHRRRPHRRRCPNARTSPTACAAVRLHCVVHLSHVNRLSVIDAIYSSQ